MGRKKSHASIRKKKKKNKKKKSRTRRGKRPRYTPPPEPVNPCEPPNKAQPEICEAFLVMHFAAKYTETLVIDSQLESMKEFSLRQARLMKRKCNALEKKYKHQYGKGIARECLKNWGPTLVDRYLPLEFTKMSGNNKQPLSMESLASVGQLFEILFLFLWPIIFLGPIYYLFKKERSTLSSRKKVMIEEREDDWMDSSRSSQSSSSSMSSNRSGKRS